MVSGQNLCISFSKKCAIIFTTINDEILFWDKIPIHGYSIALFVQNIIKISFRQN